MADKPESPSEVTPQSAIFWLDEISAAKERLDGWYKKAEGAEKRYRGDEDDKNTLEFGALNLLFANCEVQRAAIGEDFGKVQVTRVNMPEDDDGLARQVALVWERTLTAAVRDTDDNHDIALGVGDMFLPGRGQVWIEVEKEDNGWVIAQIVRVMYDAYLEGPATRWGGVPWVARKHLFTRDELISECRMTPEDAARVPLSIKLPQTGKANSDTDVGEKGKEQFKRAEVWEIWAKYPEKARIYVACGYRDATLCYDPDPLRLKKFFPCPRPLQANGDEAKPPLTDYSRYQNQAEELDRICQRIFKLTEQLKRIGFHDKTVEELADLAKAEDGVSIPIDNFAQFAANGGLANVQQWMDLLPIVNTLVELHKQRDTLIRLIYELSGISDLARGHTDPDETATAQELKQTFGSSRFKRREKESRRFAAEAYSLKGEIVAELFSREQMEMMSGIRMPFRADIEKAKQSLAMIQQAQQEAAMAAQQAQQQGLQPPPPPEPLDPKAMASLQKLAGTKWAWEDISGVLRSDARRCYACETETDQSNFIDPAAEQQQRTAFFGAVMTGLQQIAPMIAAVPNSGEIFKNMVLWVIGSFKSGRAHEEGIERVIDEGIEMARQQAQQGAQADPKAEADIEVAKLRVEQEKIKLQIEQVKLQEEMARAQGDGIDGSNAAATAQAKAAEQHAKAQASIAASQSKAAESQAKAEASVVSSQAKAVDAQTKSDQEAQKVHQQAMANEAKREGHLIDLQNKAEQLQFERDTRAEAKEALLKGPTKAPSKESA